MATNTAQILIGNSHPYDGGITNITHTLYLTENSIPTWRLTPLHDSKKEKELIWIPTLEHMLEDGLLMIGLYVIQDKKLLESYHSLQMKSNFTSLSLYEDFKEKDLDGLREIAKIVKSNNKIMISVFKGSSVLRQLPVLKNFQLDLEVCVSQYTNEYSVWSLQREEQGSLEKLV